MDPSIHRASSPRPRRRPPAAIAALLLVAGGTAAQAPQLTSASPGTLARSGRLILTGTGFGAAAATSRVAVGGAPAIATTWTDVEIHAYVPEAAPLGSTSVQVVTAAGASNPLPLSVVPRAASGRALWRLQLDAAVPGSFVAVAADGTVYATDSQRLYALDPDGALRWVVPGVTGGRPISIGSDGTVYTGRDITAVRPDGTVLWQFAAPGGAPLVAGPDLGPDGNLYAVQDTVNGGLGAFSLDRGGSLRWSDLPNPALNAAGNDFEIQFSDAATGRFYFGVRKLRSGPNPSIYAYDTGGTQRWFNLDGCQITYATGAPGMPLTYAGPASCGVTALDPDGVQLWQHAPPAPFGGGIVQQVVGPDGTVYTADFFGNDFWAVGAAGTKWFVQGGVGQMANLGVSPDNAQVVDGGRAGFGTPGWLRGYATADGRLLWQLVLPAEAGFDQATWSVRPAFSNDSRVVYATSRFAGSGPGHSYLWAVDTCDHSASRQRYGTGWPGTNGVPAIDAAAAPVLGTTLTLDLGNSLGAPTAGLLWFGTASAAAPTAFGGTLLVAGAVSLPVAVPTAGLRLPLSIPAVPGLCGSRVFAQGFEADAGASHGLAFTAGLQLELGY